MTEVYKLLDILFNDGRLELEATKKKVLRNSSSLLPSKQNTPSLKFLGQHFKGVMLSILVIAFLITLLLSLNPTKVEAEPDQNVRLDVPYMYQDDTYWCFLNSLSMVLQYYGKNVHPHDLAKTWNLGHEEGTGSILDWILSDKLEGYVEGLGLTVDWHWESAWSFEYYKSHLDASEPVLLVGHSTEWLGLRSKGVHAVVIVGYKTDSTGNYLYIHDPSGFFVSDEWGLPGGKPIEGASWQSYVAIEVPWDTFSSYFVNLANLVAMYTVIVHGTPNIPQGVLSLPQSPPTSHSLEYQNNQGQLYLGNMLAWGETYYSYAGSGQEILPNEDLDFEVRVANQFVTPKEYQLNLEIKSDQGTQVFSTSKSITLAAETMEQISFKVQTETLTTLSPGRYSVYVGLWKPNPDYTTDQPYDRIGPIEIILASNYAANDAVLIFHDAKIATAGSIIRGTFMLADVKACFRAYLQLQQNSWSWSFYADAYMTSEKAGNYELYKDTGKTELYFQVNAYDPQGNNLYSSGWISTDTDVDGIYGDFSHLGGSTPSVQSPAYPIGTMPEYIVLKTKWRIYDEFWWPIPNRWIDTQEIETASLRLKYYMKILDPITSKPAIVGDPSNPSLMQASVEVAGPLPISEDAFSITIGGKPASFSMADPPEKVPGLYAFEITTPVQDTEGNYDLNVTLNNKGQTVSTTQVQAVEYTSGPSVEPINKGLVWLRTQQYSNGSWRNNVGVTALCALAFLNGGFDESDATVHKAIQYLLSNVHGDGTIYSDWNEATYETSLALIAFVATHNTNYQNAITAAKNWLIASQWDESCVWGSVSKDSWYYGGFGYGYEIRPDLSNTQFALLALDAAGLPKDDATWAKVQVFLHRCQKVNFPITLNIDGAPYTVQPWNYAGTSGGYDGGFLYEPGANAYLSGAASMGSMTGAGIWGLLLSGVPKSDQRVTNAINWVVNNYTWDINPNSAGYRRYYYFLSMAKALTMYGEKIIGGHDWYQDLYDKIKNEMTPVGTDGGFWSIPQEDFVPDLTTAYAVLSLQTRTVAPTAQRLSYLTFILRSNAVIRILDPEGNLVGYDYDTCLGKNDLPNAVYSGLFSEPQYIIIVNPKSGTYNLELIGTSEGPYTLTIQGNYGEEVTRTYEFMGNTEPGEICGSQVTVTAIVGPIDIYTSPPAPPAISVSPTKLERKVLRGQTSSSDVTISENKGISDLTNVVLTSTNLVDRFGRAIPSSCISFSDNNFTIPAGGSKVITINLTVPSDTAYGLYTGLIHVASSGGDAVIMPDITVPGYDIYITPDNGTILQENSASAIVDVSSILGFDNEVFLNVENLPENVAISFAPDNSVPSFSSTMTISVGARAHPGTYSIAVNGITSENDKHTCIYTLTIKASVIPAIIDIDPDTLLYFENCGRVKYCGWITCFIKLPKGYDVAKIDVPSIRLNGVVPAVKLLTKPWYYRRNGDTYLMVRFDKSAVVALLPGIFEVEWTKSWGKYFELSYGKAKLTVTGLVDNAPFVGSYTIKVIRVRWCYCRFLGNIFQGIDWGSNSLYRFA